MAGGAIQAALAAAEGTPQPWNEVYQHPRPVPRRAALGARFRTAQRLERRALSRAAAAAVAGESALRAGGPAESGLSRRELDEYVAACGLDIDVGTGSLILALNALPGVATLSSCNSVHVGAHEVEALVAITCSVAAVASALEWRLGPSHFRASRDDLVVADGGEGQRPSKRRRRAGAVVARFQSYIVFSAANLPDGTMDAEGRIKDLVRLAQEVRSLALELGSSGAVEQIGGASSSKSTGNAMPALDAKLVLEVREQLALLRDALPALRAAYASGAQAAVPGGAPHAVLAPAFGREYLEEVRVELVTRLRGLRGMETKESCVLVRPLLQPGLAPDEDLRQTLPRLSCLLNVLASGDFKSLLEDVAECAPLDPQPRISIVALPPGGFWSPQCVSGDGSVRGVSFALFLVEDWWSAEDGGELELCGSNSAHVSTIVPPVFNTLLMYDAALCTSAAKVLSERAPQLAVVGTFSLAASAVDAAKEAPPPVASEPRNVEAPVVLDAADREALRAAGVALKHFQRKALRRCQSEFAEKSCLRLEGFLRSVVADEVAQLAQARDAAEVGVASPKLDHALGRSGGWELAGPACMKRHLTFAADDAAAVKRGSKRKRGAQLGASEPCAAGRAMRNIAKSLIAQGAFARYLQLVTGLAARHADPTSTLALLEARRFRPGLDYVRSSSSGAAVAGSMHVDATLCLGGKRRWRGRWAADVFVEATPASGISGLLAGPEGILPKVPILRDRPAHNVLRIVLRDADTEHLIEPVAMSSKGSRWDLACELEVEPPEGGSDSDAEGGEAGEIEEGDAEIGSEEEEDEE